MNIKHAEKILSSTPPMLSAWLGNLPQAILLKREKHGAWNTIDVLKHLIYGEETDWIPRLKQMMSSNALGTIPSFESFDRNGHEQNPVNDVADLLLAFQQVRTNNIMELSKRCEGVNLSELKGNHPDFGMVNGAELLAAWVAHDQTHIYQIARNMTSVYANQVGPWAAYLKIINQNKLDENK